MIEFDKSMLNITGEKGGFKYRALYPYFPKRYEVDEKLETIRQHIYDFKDGYPDFFLKKYRNFTIKNKQVWCCCIPASSVQKTSDRFESFLESLSIQHGINNGYNLIRCVSERDSAHLNDRKLIDPLSNVEFGNLRGKKIFLFDDVITTGRSFVRMANQCRSLGALSVYGVFLGYTTNPGY